MTQSDEEKFVEAIKPCRNCGHVNMAHKYLPKHADQVCCIDASVDSNGEYSVCQCKEFAPKDNLEFLQWKHDRKKGKKKKRA